MADERARTGRDVESGTAATDVEAPRVGRPTGGARGVPTDEGVTLELRRDRARAMLRALEELMFNVETHPALMVVERAHGLKGIDVPDEVEQLREALHAALYATAGEG